MGNALEDKKDMMTNNQVIKAWMNGHRAEARNMSTDGVNLYSYALLIAEGRKVFDYTSNGLGSVSNTTSRHVGMAKQAIQERIQEAYTKAPDQVSHSDIRQLGKEIIAGNIEPS